jgi:hypothetical protein
MSAELQALKDTLRIGYARFNRCIFFQNQTANVTTAAIAPIFYGIGKLSISGEMGGATLTFQHLPNGHAEWEDLPDGVFTTARPVSILVGKDDLMRAVVTGATGATNITATLTAIEAAA